MLLNKMSDPLVYLLYYTLTHRLTVTIGLTQQSRSSLYRSCFFPWSQFFITSVQEFTTTSKVVLKRLNISKPDSSEAQKSATQNICSDIVDSNYWKQRTQKRKQKNRKNSQSVELKTYGKDNLETCQTSSVLFFASACQNTETVRPA